MKDTINILVFLTKSIIVALVCFLLLKAILPDFKTLRNEWKEFASNRENQALVFSFIQNPVALTKAGERDFEKKKYGDAALKFELALGLFEMHGAPQSYMAPYRARFEKAKNLAESQPAN